MQDDEIRARVQQQYERFPYPGPNDNLDVFKNSAGFTNGCPWNNFHWYWPFKERTQNLDILIAGCGTSQAAKMAFFVPDARVTAIDLSSDSISHTQHVLDKYNIRNVKLHQMPIEDAGKLDQQFDLIVSTGVLHHLPDPDIGLTVLQNLLRPEGSIYLMVYGRYGRDGIYYVQETMRQLGLTYDNVTDQDIDAIRQYISLLPGTHPQRAKQAFFSQLQDRNEVVDLFLHPQDRPYSTDEILQWLDVSELKLQTFLLRAQYMPQYSGLRESKFYERICSLPEQKQWAITELYRAATSMHFFIACHRDRNEASYKVDFNSPGWQSFIPTRNPGVQFDKSNLPIGFTTRLYYIAHRFQEIQRNLTALEEALFNLADGQQSIGNALAIVENQFSSLPNMSELKRFYSEMYDLEYLWYRGSVNIDTLT